MFFRQPILLTLFICGQVASLLAAPPANDNLASAPILHFSSTTPEPSTTVEATMEAGEPFPAGYSAASYQGTVWWKWTPEVINSTGWYELNTIGSTADTVLAVWTGANYASPLSLVHVNDDVTPVTNTASRIRFLATKNVTYLISVASKSTRGAVQLQGTLSTSFATFSVPNPPFFPIPTTFTPSPANVATAAVLTVELKMKSSSGEFTSGLLTLYNPSNGVLATASVSAGNRISGSAFEGVYRMTLNLPQGSPVGTCRWGITVSNAAATQTNSYGWEHMSSLPSFLPPSVELIFDSYAAWLTENSMTGPDSVRGADYDKDGLKNLVELGCGTDPRAGTQQYMARTGNTITSTGLPVITTMGTGSPPRLRVEFARRLNDPSLTYTVQFSHNLVDWFNATTTPTVLTTNTNLGYEAVSVEDTADPPRRFGRVRVTQ